ncbi:type I restriction endonuclease subunit R [Nocardia transvalensis]|uniref:type I restriction endonuclease subunit R n=1 Tax=Nocardia transvalensis TaxID=37333 RepID=UPI0018930E23|nr:HsdR family type I site-specific deoxyribonuclease [Nocardia transvalensis]MBF6333303.1 HsdR family type I site-specific deoxyribonuclease [Nocardia transvalensis]
MTFNEANSVQSFVLQLLSKNDGPWPAVRGPELERSELDVLVDSDVRNALIRLNPEIAEEPSRADEVLYRLRGITLSARSSGLVRANEEFREWLLGEKSLPYGSDHQHVPIRLIDFQNLSRNTYTSSTEVTFRHGRVERRFDLVLWVNGIPLVVGETKTPTRPAVTWADGAFQVQGYEDDAPTFFVPNVFSFATDGRELRFGSVRMPLNQWGLWRDSDHPEREGLRMVEQGVRGLLTPRVVLDVLQDFTVYATDRSHRKIKIICRHQQYEAVNRVVDRVLGGVTRKGLIWHFQGSGKSLLMVFAAQKLRTHPRLGSPTVLIVVDRIDLDTQITGTFNAADVPNLVSTDSGVQLAELLRTEQRKIIITTIQKFREAREVLSARQDIICLVDEAHRSQEGDLGQRMRDALPGAFLFGLTGTPINARERNTFRTFGADEDPGRYLSRYTQADSLRDGTTLPLHFEPRPTEFHIDSDVISAEFDRLTDGLSEEDRESLTRRAGRMETLIKASERVAKVCADIASHFKAKVEPNGFKAQVVTFDKAACALYKDELDKLLGSDASAVVISTGSGTPKSLNDRFARSKDEEEQLLDRFRDPADPLKILIVTGRLLTGFDAPILQTMYLDKVIKDHNLLQAVCRTNRPYEHAGQTKTHGLVVDYLGVFDHLAKALEFDERAMQEVVTNISQLARDLPAAMAACLRFFPPELDRTVEGHEGLFAAQEHLPDDATRDAFAAAYNHLAKLWEALSPDPVLTEYRDDYVWLTQVYRSVQPSTDTGRLLWRMLGPKTMEIINANVHVDVLRDDLETLVLDAEMVEALEQTPERSARRVDFQLTERLRRHADDPTFTSLTDRLEQLRQQHEFGQLTSLMYLKRLLVLARQLVTLERELAPETREAGGRAALTRLFEQTRNGGTAAAVARIVSDIDDIVQKIRFPGWQHTISGEREVKKALRRTLLKYKLHRDEELFNKAYDYLRQYY